MRQNKMALRAPRRAAVAETLERRRLLAGQFFTGEGPNVAGLSQVTTADFNGDGKADIASANYSANTVSVSLGDGGGGFAAAVNYSALVARTLTTGDFNNDGRIDIVAVSNSAGGGASVLLNTGGGAFAAATHVNTVTTAYGIASGDFNNDGKPDLVTTSVGGSNYTAGISLGLGNGTFGAATIIAVGVTPQAVVTGDFNGDGKLDLATANYGVGTLSVALGNGAGGYLSSTVTTTTVGANPQSLAAGDFNGDGKLDLAVAYNPAAASAVTILLGSGFGTFAAAPQVFVGRAYAVAGGDFNGDGKPDLVVSNKTATPTVTILTGVGNGTFTTAVVNAGRTTGTVAVGDFNGDAKPDIVAAEDSSIVAGETVLLNTGTGSFVAPIVTTIGDQLTAVVAADFNDDGIADVAATSTTNVVDVTLGLGNGAFGAATSYAVSAGPTDLVTGDFNGDGALDLGVASYDAGPQTIVTVLRGVGDGTFGSPITQAIGTVPQAITTADGNHDGRADLFLVCDNRVLYTLFGSSGETLGVSFTGLGINSNAGGIVADDFNGDGQLDFAITATDADVVDIMTKGSSGYHYAQQAVGADPKAITAGDFDGNGTVDLAVANASAYTVSVLLGSGFGTFAAAPTLSPGNNPTAISAADYNGDGKTDLAITNRNLSGGYGAVVTYLGLGTGAFTVPSGAAAINAIGTTPHVVTSGDYNGDGKADLLAVSPAGGATTLLNRQTYSNAAVTVASGVVTIAGKDPVTVSEASGIMTIVTATGTLRLVATSLTSFNLNVIAATINSDLGKNGGSARTNLSVGATASVTSATSQHLTSVTASGTLAIAAGGNKLVRTNGLTIGASGRLDLNDNDLIYNYGTRASQVAAVNTLIGTARNGGAWNGSGLTSTTAKNNAAHGTTLGAIEAANYKAVYGSLATFAGEAIDTTTVVVRYTLYGDTDLDRGVSINDFNRLAVNFGTTSKTWFGGDFDNDGGVSINDFNLLAANFGKTLAVPAALPRKMAPVKHKA